ncbi:MULTISPECIES: TCP-1/cpn60 chaperonin family protein [unclassified Streptomyces]|uniref:TCP-1/cpn60 chaperonin family protein n=1 Tax=unclassified Streptomyces TaxID=2593676 RepID=UPI003646213C
MRPGPAAPDEGLETVTAPTEGKPTLAESRAVLAAAERRVARLERSGVPVATGFLVRPGLLLTAGHAVRLDLGVTGTAPVAGMVAVFDHRGGPHVPPAEGGVRVPLAELLESSPPATDDPPAPGLPRAPDGLDFALVRLAHHPPDVWTEQGGPVPRDHYELRPQEYAFTAKHLHVFHHSLTWALGHGQTTAVQVAGQRVRYRGVNTDVGASGGPVVTRDGLLVALHHGHRKGMNEAVPTSLIRARIDAGPHARLFTAPVEAPRRHPGGARVGEAGEARGPWLGPRRSYPAPTGPTGEDPRAVTAREVAAHFRPDDPVAYATGAALVVEAARAMDEAAGDGAVTAAVLAAALIREAARRRAAGEAAHLLARGAVAAVDRVRQELARCAEPCADPLPVARAATADLPLAEAVSAAALLAGGHGILLCEPGDTRGVEAPVRQQGLRLPAGHALPYDADAHGTDRWTRRTRLVQPYVLLLGPTTGDGETFRRLRGQIASEGRQLLIVAMAEGADPRAGLLRSLADPADGPVPALVRLDAGPGSHRLRALAVLTGGTPLTEESGLLPGNAWFDVLGRADLAVVSPSRTLLLGGHHAPRTLEWWTASTRTKRAMAGSDAERSALDELLGWLTSRSVTLRVGAHTRDGIAPRAAAAQRAAEAARAALRSGTLPGGGLALLRARAVLPAESAEPGADVVRAALAAPFRLLAAAAGLGEAEIERYCAGPPAPEPIEAPEPFVAPDGKEPRDAAELVLPALDTAAAALTAFLGTA